MASSLTSLSPIKLPRRCFGIRYLSLHQSPTVRQRNQLRSPPGRCAALSLSFSNGFSSQPQGGFPTGKLQGFRAFIASSPVSPFPWPKLLQSFCGETEDEHGDTLSLVRAVGYDMAYMFAYSMREKTRAHINYADDVPEEVKQRRLNELIEAFRESTGQCYDS